MAVDLPLVIAQATVLVVEDEAELRALASEILQGQGYAVLEAVDGVEAVSVAECHQGPIHLLVTDVVMPRRSGRALAEGLRAARPEMKVIYMSGYTDDAVGHHGALEPGVALLEKPFTPDALLGKVREALEAPGAVSV
jgi:CheY-like chemotaxis protein